MKLPIVSRLFARRAAKKAPQKRGPQAPNRIAKTRDFLDRTAARLRTEADRHNLPSATADDYKALGALMACATCLEREARALCEPELPGLADFPVSNPQPASQHENAR